MGVEFDPVNKYIKITSPTTEISTLEIYNLAMDWCDDQSTMGYTVPMKAVGKAPLGGGAYTDSIFVLINGWKIKPYDGDYQLKITGTLITDDESVRWVNPDSGNVGVEFQVSSQATVIDEDVMLEQISAIHRIETGRWKVNATTKQMIFYDNDGETPLLMFNLKDKTGQPSSEDVYERVPA